MSRDLHSGALRVGQPEPAGDKCRVSRRGAEVKAAAQRGLAKRGRFDLGEHRGTLNHRRLQHGPLFGRITALCASG